MDDSGLAIQRDNRILSIFFWKNQELDMFSRRVIISALNIGMADAADHDTLFAEPNHPTLSVDCLVYCRVSTEEQADKGYSLDAQEKLCREFAERSSYRVAGVYRDEGKSGTTLDRPALQDLLAKCTNGTVINAVIVQETDRLARNTHDH